MSAEVLSARYPRRIATVTVDRDGVEARFHLHGRTSVYRTNSTGFALWELCDGATTVEEMVTAICTLFDVDERAAGDDVDRALATFTDLGLVEWLEVASR